MSWVKIKKEVRRHFLSQSSSPPWGTGLQFPLLGRLKEEDHRPKVCSDYRLNQGQLGVQVRDKGLNEQTHSPKYHTQKTPNWVGFGANHWGNLSSSYHRNFFLSFLGSVPQNERSPRDNACNGGTSWILCYSQDNKVYGVCHHNKKKL